MSGLIVKVIFENILLYSPFLATLPKRCVMLTHFCIQYTCLEESYQISIGKRNSIVTGAQTEAETETLFASDDSGSEDEDMLETELFDDSDNEKEYFPDPEDSSDEEYTTPPKRTRGKKKDVLEM
ncbi:hypothetical protein Avbf_14774 [Armadillidium vulgare]|nr:hypothetical protein Avbf_14774 [Armadillidium vulgare]